MITHFHIRQVAAVVIVAALRGATVDAAVVKTTVPELTAHSDHIVIGDVSDAVSFWNQDRTLIFTRVVVAVTDKLKGNAGESITLDVLGGKVDDLTLATTSTPRLQAGDHVLLFLKGPDHRLTADYQGAYLTDGVNIAGTESGFRERIKMDSIRPLGEFLEEVRMAIPGAAPFDIKPYEGPFTLDGVQTFTLIGADWTWMPNPMGESYQINGNCADASAGSAAQQITALNLGAAAWDNAGAAFTFTYGGTTTAAVTALNSQNIIFFRNTAGMAPETIAATSIWMQGSNIVEWDMEFNDFQFTFWNGVTGSCSNMMDIQSVACHEFGHALGLGHSATASATMFASVAFCDTNPRTLESDDVNGIQSIYGATDIVWVDFAYAGPTSNGSFDQPYKTLPAALAAVTTGGTIRIKSGSTSQTLNNANQPATLEAYEGEVTIGQ